MGDAMTENSFSFLRYFGFARGFFGDKSLFSLDATDWDAAADVEANVLVAVKALPGKPLVFSEWCQRRAAWQSSNDGMFRIRRLAAALRSLDDLVSPGLSWVLAGRRVCISRWFC